MMFVFNEIIQNRLINECAYKDSAKRTLFDLI